MTADIRKTYLNPVEKDPIKQNSATRQLLGAVSGITYGGGLLKQDYDTGGGGSGTQIIYNQLFIENDSSDTSVTYGQLQYMGVDGGTGQKIACLDLIQLNADSATGNDLIGNTAIAQATKNNGGTDTSTGAAGTLYGYSGGAIAYSGATNYLVVAGGEANARIMTGGSAAHRWGWSIVNYGDLQGAQTDAALNIAGADAAYWKTVISINNTSNGQPAIGATSSILKAVGAVTITDGIDLATNLTYTGVPLQSPGFSVDKNGNIAGVSVKTSTVLTTNLPTAVGAGGTRYLVSDANSTTFNAVAAGGGANIVPVFSNGTTWRIG